MRYPDNDWERRKWQNPEQILSAIGLKSGDTFVDVGCGEGFFALPAARMVGEEGRVYGIDIDQAAIAHLSEAAEKEGLKSLHAVVGEAESTIICQGCANVIFYGICLHDFRDPAEALTCARQMVNRTGTLIDLDWKPESTPIGPPLQIRFSVNKARHLIEHAGFAVKAVGDAGLWHYCITAIPS
jgi:ubiquinone/menaquinone biosynthesis C-methylase UbiE